MTDSWPRPLMDRRSPLDPFEAVRERAVRGLAWLLVALFLPLVLLVVWTEARRGGLTPALMAELVGVLAAVAGVPLTIGRSTTIRALAQLIPMTIAGVATVIHFGPQGGVVAAGVLLALFAHVVFRWWGSLSILGIILTATVVSGLLFSGGSWANPDLYDLTRPAVWIRIAVSTAVAMIGVALLFEVTFRALTVSHEHERDAELARLSAERALAASHQLEVLGRLAGGVAHDVNNALTVVLGNAELARSTEHAGERIVLLDELISAANSAAETTRQLLAVSRRAPRRIETLIVSESVDRCAKTLTRLVPDDIALDLQISGCRSIAADSNLLTQALLNLAINARDAMPNGGRLTLGAEDHVSGGVRVWVSDTGVGMDQATMARAPEAFYTTKPDGQGTGLGLHMVSEFAVSSGGAFGIDSAPGRGTTVTLTFPAMVPYTPIQGQTPSGDLRGFQILVAEDEAPIRDLLRRHLSASGAEVVLTCSAIEALDRVRQRRHDLLITDAVMPGGGTMELIDTFRHRGSGKVLLISGHVQQDLVRRGIDSGAVHYLAKPFGRDQLLEAVFGALRDSRGPAGREVIAGDPPTTMTSSPDGGAGDPPEASSYRVLDG